MRFKSSQGTVSRLLCDGTDGIVGHFQQVFRAFQTLCDEKLFNIDIVLFPQNGEFAAFADLDDELFQTDFQIDVEIFVFLIMVIVVK